MALLSSDLHASLHLPIVYGWSQSQAACGQCIAAVSRHLTMNTFMKFMFIKLTSEIRLTEQLRPHQTHIHLARHVRLIWRQAAITYFINESDTYSQVLILISIGLGTSLIRNPGRIICLNTLRPSQNGRHFADDIFKCIFLNWSIWILIKFHWSLFLRVQLIICHHWFR